MFPSASPSGLCYLAWYVRGENCNTSEIQPTFVPGRWRLDKVGLPGYQDGKTD
jgi:hypothetical protein